MLGAFYKSEQFINCAAHFMNPHTFTWFRARDRARARVRARVRASKDVARVHFLLRHRLNFSIIAM